MDQDETTKALIDAALLQYKRGTYVLPHIFADAARAYIAAHSEPTTELTSAQLRQLVIDVADIQGRLSVVEEWISAAGKNSIETRDEIFRRLARLELPPQIAMLDELARPAKPVPAAVQESSRELRRAVSKWVDMYGDAYRDQDTYVGELARAHYADADARKAGGE